MSSLQENRVFVLQVAALPGLPSPPHLKCDRLQVPRSSMRALITVACSLLLAGCGAHREQQAPSRNTDLPATTPPAPSTDVTRGAVRLVLMSVGKTMVFPSETNAAGARFGFRQEGEPGVACLTVTFLLELLGDRPFHRKSARVAVLADGQPIRFLNDQHSTYQQWFDYPAYHEFLDIPKPAVTSPQRAFILRHARFGELPDRQLLTLRIEAGFDDDLQEYIFEPVRLP